MEDVFKSIEEVLDLYPAATTVSTDTPVTATSDPAPISDRERLEIIVHKLKFIPLEQRSRVTYLQDVSPIAITPSDYLDRLIRIAGGIPVTDPSAGDFNPGVLILISDKPISQLLSELPNALSTSFWSASEAVRNNNVFVIHHPEYLREPGKHLAEDAEILAEIINPGYFVYGRDEDAWMQFSV